MSHAPRAGEGGEPFLVVGVIRKPHGVRGELQISVETDRPAPVFRKGRVLQLGDAAGRPSGGSITLEQARPMKDGLLIRVAEHANRETVEALRGRTLLIPASESAPAAADEVPYHRLVGCAVVVGDETLGLVAEVLEVGGGEMLAVRRATGKELLIPFVNEMVRSVDLERRRVVVDPPEGLLDL